MGIADIPKMNVNCISSSSNFVYKLMKHSATKKDVEFKIIQDFS